MFNKKALFLLTLCLKWFLSKTVHLIATGGKRKPIEEEDREEPDDNNEEREEEEEEDEGEYSDQEEEGATKDEETVDSTVNIQHKLTSDEFITAEEVKNHFIQLWNTESKAMKHLLGSHKNPDGLKKVTTPEIFFLDLVMVTPVKFRPVSFDFLVIVFSN